MDGDDREVYSWLKERCTECKSGVCLLEHLQQPGQVGHSRCIEGGGRDVVRACKAGVCALGTLAEGGSGEVHAQCVQVREWGCKQLLGQVAVSDAQGQAECGRHRCMQDKAEVLAPAASIRSPVQPNPPALVITSNALSSYGSLGSSFRSFTAYSVCNKQTNKQFLNKGREAQHSWHGACPPATTALLAWGVPRRPPRHSGCPHTADSSAREGAQIPRKQAHSSTRISKRPQRRRTSTELRFSSASFMPSPVGREEGWAGRLSTI